MKISLTFSVLLMVVFAILGWKNHERLEVAKSTRSQLVREAVELSIPPSDDGPRVTKHEREIRESDAATTTAEILAFLKDASATHGDGSLEGDSALTEHLRKIRGRIEELTLAELKALIVELDGATETKGEAWKKVMGFSLDFLRHDHPRELLALFARLPGLFDNAQAVESTLSSALYGLSKEDPMAALEWFRKYAKDHPDLLSDKAKHAIVGGTAAQDPGLAFKLGSQLEIADVSSLESDIVSGMRTDEARTKILKGLREYLGSLGDREAAKGLQTALLRSFARESTYQGFNAATKWVAANSLSPDELADFAVGVAHGGNYKDTGEWVQWMSANLPADVANSTIHGMVSNWSRNDYRAAGKWLAGLAEGDFRNLSVSAFAKEISHDAPAAAVQWAKTLPPGRDRDEIIHGVYVWWPKEDPEGRAAFAKEHGIP